MALTTEPNYRINPMKAEFATLNFYVGEKNR
jgi:hypothetical protein